MGLYFLETAAGPLEGHVVYDRAESSFSHLAGDEINWPSFLDTRILHLTGITPALSSSNSELVSEAIARAREARVAISFDVNFRRKLWEPERARAVLLPLLRAADLVICGEADARELLRTGGNHYEILHQLLEATTAPNVILTRGADGAVARFEGQPVEVNAVDIRVVDSIGAGDAFAAGVLDGWLDGDLVDGLRRGTILAAVKLSQHGDSISITRDEFANCVDLEGKELIRR